MVNQLLGVSSESEVGEMAQLFSTFVDGCLSLPVSLPGFAYHTAMNVSDHLVKRLLYMYNLHFRFGYQVYIHRVRISLISVFKTICGVF